LIIIFLIALTTAYLGLASPGMLNMTACKISVERGAKEAFHFSIGASIVVVVQAYLALTFAKLISTEPTIIANFKIAGIVIFFLLSFYFFSQARKPKKEEDHKKPKKGNFFLIGMGLSALNALAIPFYLAIGIYSEEKGWLRMILYDKIIFVLGASLGVFLLLKTYCRFAQTILRKSKLIARNSNYILSILFLVLGFVALFNVL